MALDAEPEGSGISGTERMKKLLDQATAIHKKLQVEVGDGYPVASGGGSRRFGEGSAKQLRKLSTGTAFGGVPQQQLDTSNLLSVGGTGGGISPSNRLRTPGRGPTAPQHRQSYLHDVESNLEEVRTLLDKHLEDKERTDEARYQRNRQRRDTDAYDSETPLHADMYDTSSKDTQHNPFPSPTHAAQDANANAAAAVKAVVTEEKECQTDGPSPVTPRQSPIKPEFKMNAEQRTDFEQLSSVRDTLGKKLTNLRTAYKGLADRERQKELMDLEEMQRNLEFYEEERIYLYSKIFGCHPSKFPEGATRQLPDVEEEPPASPGNNSQMQRDLEQKVKQNKRLADKLSNVTAKFANIKLANWNLKRKLEQLETLCFAAHEYASQGNAGGEKVFRRKRDTGTIQSALPSGGLFDRDTDEHVPSVMKFAELKVPNLDTSMKGIFDEVRGLAVRTDQATVRTFNTLAGMAKPNMAGLAGETIRKHQEAMHEIFYAIEKSLKGHGTDIVKSDREYAASVRRKSPVAGEGVTHCDNCGQRLPTGDDDGSDRESVAPSSAQQPHLTPPPRRDGSRRSIVDPKDGNSSPLEAAYPFVNGSGEQGRGMPCNQRSGSLMIDGDPGEGGGMNADAAMLSFENEVLKEENETMKMDLEDLQRQVDEWQDKYNTLLEEAHDVSGEAQHTPPTDHLGVGPGMITGIATADSDNDSSTGGGTGTAGSDRKKRGVKKAKAAAAMKAKTKAWRKDSDIGRPPLPGSAGEDAFTAAGGVDSAGGEEGHGKSAGYGAHDKPSGKLFSHADNNIRPIYQASLAFHHVLVRFLDKLRQLLQIPDILIQSRVQLIQQRARDLIPDKGNPDDLLVRVQRLVNKDRTVLVAFADIFRKDTVNANRLGAMRRAIHSDHRDEYDEAERRAPRHKHADDDASHDSHSDEDALGSGRGKSRGSLSGEEESPRPLGLKRGARSVLSSKSLRGLRCPCCGREGWDGDNREMEGSGHRWDAPLTPRRGGQPMRGMVYVADGEVGGRAKHGTRISKLFPTAVRIEPHGGASTRGNSPDSVGVHLLDDPTMFLRRDPYAADAHTTLLRGNSESPTSMYPRRAADHGDLAVRDAPVGGLKNPPRGVACAALSGFEGDNWHPAQSTQGSSPLTPSDGNAFRDAVYAVMEQQPSKCVEWFENGNAGHAVERAAGAITNATSPRGLKASTLAPLVVNASPDGDVDMAFPPIRATPLSPPGNPEMSPALAMPENGDPTVPVQVYASSGLPALADTRLTSNPVVAVRAPVALERRKSERVRILNSVEEEARLRRTHKGQATDLGLQGVPLSTSGAKEPAAEPAASLQTHLGFAPMQFDGDPRATEKNKEILARVTAAHAIEAMRKRKVSLTITSTKAAIVEDPRSSPRSSAQQARRQHGSGNAGQRKQLLPRLRKVVHSNREGIEAMKQR